MKDRRITRSNPTMDIRSRPLRSSPGVLTALCLCMLAAALELPAAPELIYLGDLPGGSVYSAARGVSADGTYVVGESSSTFSGPTNTAAGYPAQAFLWDATNGMVALSVSNGTYLMSSARSVTPDGKYVVGSAGVTVYDGDPFNEEHGEVAAIRCSLATPQSTRSLLSYPAPGSARFRIPAGQAAAISITPTGDIVVGSSLHYE